MSDLVTIRVSVVSATNECTRAATVPIERLLDAYDQTVAWVREDLERGA